jgi:hypothetical protein
MVPNHPPLITLNSEGWERECDRYGLVSDGQRAEFLGLTRKCVNEIQNNRRGAGERVICAALSRFKGARFEDLFVTRKIDGAA